MVFMLSHAVKIQVQSEKKNTDRICISTTELFNKAEYYLDLIFAGKLEFLYQPKTS